MTAALKALLFTLAVVVALGLAALYVASWPWRAAARAAGISGKRRSSKTATAALVEATLALALSALGLKRQSSGRVVTAWQPCAQCGGMNYRRSAFCSDACRKTFEWRKREANAVEEIPF